MEDIIQQKPLDKKKHRYWELDFIRGICVLLMVFDHFMYTMGYLMPSIGEEMGVEIWNGAGKFVAEVYWTGGLRSVAHIIVTSIFFLICGISCTFSRSNLKRGGLCFLVACGITFFTVVAEKITGLYMAIYFGVLHMLGIAMLLYGVFDIIGALICKLGKNDKSKKITKIIGDYLAPTVGLILLIVFFACFYDGIDIDVFATNVVIEDRTSSVLASLFLNVNLPNSGSYDWIIGGEDYWPLLPYAAIVLVGGFIGRGIYHNKKTQNYLAKLDGKWNKPVCFVGRHALIVYVAHQVAIFALLYLVTLIAA